MCKQAGIRLEYLPLYSLDFNPIKAYFSDMKISESHSLDTTLSKRNSTFKLFLHLHASCTL